MRTIISTRKSKKYAKGKPKWGYQIPMLVIIGVLIAGCSSYKSMKTKDVDIVYNVDGISAKDLSLCVEDQLTESTFYSGPKYHRKYDRIRKKWFILVELSSLLNTGIGYYTYSLSFSDAENNSVSTVVELRSLKGVGGRLYAPEQAIKDIIDMCKKS